MTPTSIDLAALEALADVLAEKVAERLPRLDADDCWMTSAKAADYLDVPISTLRKLTAAGSVPFAQDVPGGRCYFKRSELDRWRRDEALRLPRGGSPDAKIRPTKQTRKWPRDVGASGAVAQGGRAP
jgi:excisionase family DNA binding protein